MRAGVGAVGVRSRATTVRRFAVVWGADFAAVFDEDAGADLAGGLAEEFVGVGALGDGLVDLVAAGVVVDCRLRAP